jgi:predicted amidohydrolase
LAEPVEGPTVSRLRETATENGVAVLCGSIVEDLSATDSVETPEREGLANTAVLLDADGSRELVYRKRHLFGYGSAEAELLEPGQRLPTASLGGFEVGVATCYDLRFPAQFGDLAAAGTELVLVPSAWPYPRLEHWEVLPKARAVENAFYVVAANGVGEFEEASLLGRSTAYDPWGTAIASTGTDPGLVLADADPERVSDVREEFPAWQDRFE